MIEKSDDDMTCSLENDDNTKTLQLGVDVKVISNLTSRALTATEGSINHISPDELNKYTETHRNDICINLKNKGITDTILNAADQFLEFISNNVQMQELDLSDNNLGDRGVKLVASALMRNNHLIRLTLINVRINHAVDALIDLSQKHPQLIEIDIEGNNKINSDKKNNLKKYLAPKYERTNFQCLTNIGDRVLYSSDLRYHQLKMTYIRNENKSRKKIPEFQDELKKYISLKMDNIIDECFYVDTNINIDLSAFVKKCYDQKIKNFIDVVVKKLFVEGLQIANMFKVTHLIESCILEIFFDLLTTKNAFNGIGQLLNEENCETLFTLFHLQFKNRVKNNFSPKLYNKDNTINMKWGLNELMMFGLDDHFKLLAHRILVTLDDNRGKRFEDVMRTTLKKEAALMMLAYLIRKSTPRSDDLLKGSLSFMQILPITDRLKDPIYNDELRNVVKDVGENKVIAIFQQLFLRAKDDPKQQATIFSDNILLKLLLRMINKGGYSGVLNESLMMLRRKYVVQPILLSSNFNITCNVQADIVATLRLTEKSLKRYIRYRMSDKFFNPFVKYSSLVSFCEDNSFYDKIAFQNNKILCTIMIPGLGAVTYLHYTGARHSGNSRGAIEFETQLFGSYSTYIERIKDIAQQAAPEYIFSEKTALQYIQSMVKLVDPTKVETIMSAYIRQQIIDTLLPFAFTVFYIEPIRNPVSFAIHPLALQSAIITGSFANFIELMPMTQQGIAPAARALHQSSSSRGKSIMSPQKGTGNTRDQLKNDQLKTYRQATIESSDTPTDDQKLDFIQKFWNLKESWKYNEYLSYSVTKDPALSDQKSSECVNDCQGKNY